jgi:hypothetical protein
VKKGIPIIHEFHSFCTTSNPFHFTPYIRFRLERC